MILPSLKQLRYLVALSEHEHFSRAAEACSVTQSTLSAGIKELETLLGASLAERTKRSVRLTPLGRDIAERSIVLLREAEDIVELAAAGRAPLTGDLHLGVIPTIGPFLLPKVLPAIRRRYPKLRLFLREEQTADLLTRLADGRLDAVLMAFPYPTEGVRVRMLLDDRFRLACVPGHRLAGRNSVSDADIVGEPLMLLEEGHCLRGHALDACHMDERGMGREFEATSLATLVPMVAEGLGITLLPELAIRAGIAAGAELALVPFSGPSAKREIGLAWRKSSTRAHEFELLADMLAGSAPSTE